jgi:hypothetical protein
MTTDARSEGSAWSGWVLFAGTMLAAIGFINGIQGLAALLKDEVYVITDSGLLVTTDWTAWGWTLLIWGALLVLAGIGLFSGKSWARWFAVVVVFINLVAQFAWFPAYPLWSLVAIGLGVGVLWALTAGWKDVRADVNG